MSELTDFIRNYPPAALAKILLDQKDWRVFNLLWAEPEGIIAACDAMGWQTIDDVVQWVQKTNGAIGAVDAFIANIDPPTQLDYDALPKIAWADIHAAIAAQCNLRDDIFVERSDAEYRLPSKAQWEYLAQACVIKKRKWKAERMDCDDFVRGFLGWLASNGIGNCAAGFCATTPYNIDGQIIGGHAVVLCMDDAMKVWILEPQDGKLYEPKSKDAARLGGFFWATSMKIARAYF